MSAFLNFIKTTAIGGLLVIIPASVLLFLFAQLLFGVYSLGLEVAHALPGFIPRNPTLILGLALATIVGVCFVTGLIVRTRIGVAIRDHVEARIAQWVPMYKPIRSLTRRIAGMDEDQFAPVEVDLHGSSARVIGFLIEVLPDRRLSVFIPGSPVATVGQLYIVPETNVTRLSTTTASAMTAVTQWGVESSSLYAATEAAPRSR